MHCIAADRTPFRTNGICYSFTHRTFARIGIEPVGHGLLERTGGAPQVQHLVAVLYLPVDIVHAKSEAVDGNSRFDGARADCFHGVLHRRMVGFARVSQRNGEVERADEDESQFGDRQYVVQIPDGCLGLDDHTDESLPVLGGNVVVGKPPAAGPRRPESSVTGPVVVAESSGFDRLTYLCRRLHARQKDVPGPEIERLPDQRWIQAQKSDEQFEVRPFGCA